MPSKWSVHKRTLLVVTVIAFFGCGRKGPSNKLAAEGRGTLPSPVTIQGKLTGAPNYAFLSDSAELSSRVVFETEEDPNFNIRIRDYSVPPGRGPVGITSANVAILEMRTDRGTLEIGKSPQTWNQGGTATVPAGTPIQLTNPTDRELIIRLYYVEGK
jgi:hypothetical protein